MNKNLTYEISIQTGYVLPNSDIDAISFIIEDREELQRLIDLSVKHGYVVEIKEYSHEE
jgi:hypothetical protein